MGDKQDKPRRITAPVDEHGLHTVAPIGRLRAQSAHVLGSPVILMLQPDSAGFMKYSGETVYSDSTEVAVRHHGGKRLMPPKPQFATDPAPGWTATLDTATDELLIHFPDGLVFYDGTMPTNGTWVPDVRKTGAVAVITGPMPTLADVEPIIVGGRAHTVTIAITITG